MSLLLIAKIVCFSSLSISSGHLFSWKAELEPLPCIVSLLSHQDLRTFWNGMHFCKIIRAPREVFRRQVRSAPDSCRFSHFPWRRWEIWKLNCLQADISGEQPVLWPLLGEQCVQLWPQREIRSQLFFTITRIQIYYDLLSFVSSSLNFSAWHPGHPRMQSCVSCLLCLWKDLRPNQAPLVIFFPLCQRSSLVLYPCLLPCLSISTGQSFSDLIIHLFNRKLIY